MNLLTKLRENLRKDSFNMDESASEMYKDIRVSRKNKIAKKVAGVALALGLATAPITLSACNITIDPDNGITIERPNDDPNTDNPSTDNPSTDDPTTDNPPEEITSQHSDIFNTVVYGDYYNKVEADYFGDYKNKPSNLTNAIPYKFLEDEGYDIDAIKKDTYECKSNSYIYDNAPNDLYMSVQVENPNTVNGKNYYTNYILKYNLTDQEKEDLDLIFSDRYIEAAFFMQELSYHKTPEIISETKLTIDSYWAFDECYSERDGRVYIYDLIDTFIEDDNIGYVLQYIPMTDSGIKHKTNLTTEVVLSRWNAGTQMINGVFDILYPERVNIVESDLNGSMPITNYKSNGNIWFERYNLEEDLQKELDVNK